jgi:carbonic anhydrase
VIPAAEALARLRDGNRRFADETTVHSGSYRSRRLETAPNQEPFAIILGCSDSRVPAEIVFDQGLGDLFVIRVAGNIVAPSQVGSVEFARRAHRRAARRRARPLALRRDPGHARRDGPSVHDQSRNLRSIVERIRPAIEPILLTQISPTDDALIRRAVRANVLTSTNHLRHGSEILERLIQTDGLLIVGAEYCLETGLVEFFDGV